MQVDDGEGDLIYKITLKVRESGPIRARRLASLLRQDGEKVKREDVNRVLYANEQFTKNDRHEWSVQVQEVPHGA